MKALWMKGGVIALALAVGFGSYLFTGKSDGPIEQGAEAVLRLNGVEIDLSPE